MPWVRQEGSLQTRLSQQETESSQDRDAAEQPASNKELSIWQRPLIGEKSDNEKRRPVVNGPRAPQWRGWGWMTADTSGF